MTTRQRASLEIEGIVQGVGFRPFVYRLAGRYDLAGWVRNTGRGVQIEAEGPGADLDAFARAIRAEAPPLAVISSLKVQFLDLAEGGQAPTEPVPGGESSFRILESAKLSKGGEISPDCEVCDDCLAELLDPKDRRYRYPFINCTNCGPRYSIITGIPYDRPATTMASFPMCDACLAEYHDPLNRRFHAQPNACPVCGPQLKLLDRSGAQLPGDPLSGTLAALFEGKIMAIKGVGGYHLAVDACSDEAVARLRERKKRDEKPFALLAADLEEIRGLVHCSELEGRLLTGVERPIVLMRKRPGNPICRLVAPDNGWLGIMLPGNPLQHLLMSGFGAPLVMTSGNLSDEPIAYREGDALERLSGIADLFLTHDRDIHTRTDDSVLRLSLGEPLFLRRSRGYVPRGVNLLAAQPSVLAVGAELKGTICITREARGFMSQHIGDLKNAATLLSLEETVRHLGQLLEVAPQFVAHDLHPDYLSTDFAERTGLPRVAVQHHHAHLASCMAENGLDGEVIGVILDGTGYGDDGAIWGGEFLLGGYGGYRRRGHFNYLRLPGGDAAVREPYRMALSVLHGLFGDRLFERPIPFLPVLGDAEKSLFLKMLERGINSPYTSSCGRLFDAVAALVGVRNRISYEGQAAIELEALAERGTTSEPYPFTVLSTDLGGSSCGRGNALTPSPLPEGEGDDCHRVDFLPAVAAICDDLAGGRQTAEMARAFHLTVANAIVEVCGKIRQESGVDRVALSGGVFQNRLLTEEAARRLEAAGFRTFCHRLVPPNDGGLALGQAVVAGRMVQNRQP